MNRLAVLANGRVAVVAMSGEIGIWGAFSGTRFGSLPRQGPSRKALPVIAALPDGRLAVGEADGSIRLWNVSSRREVGRLDGQAAPVTAVAALADGTLISGDRSGRIVRRDKDTGKIEQLFDIEHRGAVDAVIIQDEDFLLSLDGATRRLLTYHIWGGLYDCATALGQSPITALAQVGDGWVAAGCSDHRIRLVDTLRGRPPSVLEGHRGAVTAVCPLDDCRMASAGCDGTVRFWDFVDDCEIACHRVDDVPSALALHPDGRLVIAGPKGELSFMPFALPDIE